MMQRVLVLLAGFLCWLPGIVAVEEAVQGSYWGIASIYYTLIGGILAYRLLDAFGRKAMDIGAPILAVIIYFLLPSG